METKTQITLAKEIKILFYLILLGIAFVGMTFGIMYVALKPPINAPVPQEVKNRINQGGVHISVGDAFSNHSKYDNGITESVILNDKINEYRMSGFKYDIQEKIKTVTIIIFILLLAGRYIILLIKWVNRTSRLEKSNP